MRKIKPAGSNHDIEIILVSALLLYGLYWLLIGRHIPGYRERLYQKPISCIQQILILYSNPDSLSQRNLFITDAETIREIITALRAAKPYSPNHPSTKWRCTLVIADDSGESLVDVIDSSGQGTILYVKTAEGFIFDRLQNSTMGRIIERVIRENS